MCVSVCIHLTYGNISFDSDKIYFFFFFIIHAQCLACSNQRQSCMFNGKSCATCATVCVCGPLLDLDTLNTDTIGT